MKWLLFIFLGLFLLLLLLLLTKLTVSIHINHSQDNDHIKIKLRAWLGLLRYTINIPSVKVDKKKPGIKVKHEEKSNLSTKGDKKKEKKFSAKEILKSMEDTKKVIEHVLGLHKIIKKFMRKITITKFEWHSVFGVGDAAHTGMLTGVAWTIKGGLLGIISQYMQVKVKPNVSITPDFQRAHSETKLLCIFHFRIGNAILAGLSLVKYWRGGMPHFQTKPLSNLSGGSKKSVKS